MVTSLARQAIIIKSGNDTSIITGNYELAYALGFLANQTGISIPEGDAALRDLQEKILDEVKSKKFDDEKMKRLLRMVRLYNPDPVWDEQVQELLHMGLTEKCPWDLHRA